MTDGPVTTFPAPRGTTSPTITLSYGGGTTSAVGSYIGTDNGAKSKVTIDIAGSQGSITATCESKMGFKSLTIDGGSATGA